MSANASLVLQNSLLLYENNKLQLSVDRHRTEVKAKKANNVKSAVRALSRSLFVCAVIYEKRMHKRLVEGFAKWRYTSLLDRRAKQVSFTRTTGVLSYAISLFPAACLLCVVRPTPCSTNTLSSLLCRPKSSHRLVLLSYLVRRNASSLLSFSFSFWRRVSSYRKFLSRLLSRRHNSFLRLLKSRSFNIWRRQAACYYSLLISSTPLSPPAPRPLLYPLLFVLSRCCGVEGPPRRPSRLRLLHLSFLKWSVASSRVRRSSEKDENDARQLSVARLRGLLVPLLRSRIRSSSLMIRTPFLRWRDAAKKTKDLASAAKLANRTTRRLASLARILGTIEAFTRRSAVEQRAVQRWRRHVRSLRERSDRARVFACSLGAVVSRNRFARRVSRSFATWIRAVQSSRHAEALETVSKSFQLHFEQQSDAHRLHDLSAKAELSEVVSSSLGARSLSASRARLLSALSLLRVLVRSVSSRILRNSLSRLFRLWSFLTFRSSLRLASLAGTLVLVSRLFRHRLCRSAFQTWTTFYAAKRSLSLANDERKEQQRQKARAMSMYILRAINRSLAKGFETWFSTVKEIKAVSKLRLEKERSMKRVLCHMTRRLLSAGYLQWRAVSNTIAEVERKKEAAIKTIQVVMLRACSLELFKGFNNWKTNTVVFALREAAEETVRRDVKRNKDKSIRRVLSHMTLRLLSAAFSQWLAVDDYSRNKEAAMTKVLCHMSGRVLSAAMNQWLSVVSLYASAQRGKEDAVKTIWKACKRMEKGEAGRAFLTWKDVDRYVQESRRNRFLGVDMMRKTVATVLAKKVAQGFNSWRVFVVEKRKKDKDMYYVLRNMLKTITRLTNRRVYVCFNTWLAATLSVSEKLAAVEAERRVQDLQAKMKGMSTTAGLQSVAIVLKSAESRQVSRAFKNMKDMQQVHLSKKKLLRSVFAHMTKNAMFLSFSTWSDFVFNNQRKELERRRLAKVVRNTLLKMERVVVQKAFKTLKEMLARHQQHVRSKNFAARLLKQVILKLAGDNVRFAFSLWWHETLAKKAEQTEKSKAVSFIFAVAQKSHSLATKRCFKKWVDILRDFRDYRVQKINSEKHLSRMTTVIARFLKDLQTRAFVVWRSVLIAEKFAHERDGLVRSVKLAADKLDSQQLMLNDKRKESNTFAAMMIKRVIMQITKQKTASSFHAWRRHAQGAKHASAIEWQQKKAGLVLLNLISMKAAGFATRKAFLTWIGVTREIYQTQLEASQREKSRRAVLWKIVLGLRNKVQRAAYNSWRAHISAIARDLRLQEERTATLRNVVLRIQHKLLHLAFYSYRKNVAEATSRLDVRRQMILRSSQTIKLFILKIIHTSQARAFQSWRKSSEKVKKARSLSLYIFRAINRSLAKGFETWFSTVKEIKAVSKLRLEKERSMKRVLCHMTRRLLSAGYLQWRAVSNTIAEVERKKEAAIKTIQVVMLRACSLELFKGFNNWKTNTVVFALREAAEETVRRDVKRNKDKSIRRVLSHMTLRLLSAAFSQWLAVDDYSRNKEAAMTKVLCHMSGRVLSAAMNQWRAANEVDRREQAALKTIQISMIRTCNRSLFAGFRTWRINTIVLAKNLAMAESVRQAMLTTLSFAGASIVRCFVRMEGKNLRNCFLLWLRETHLAIKKERRSKLRDVACHTLFKTLKKKQSHTVGVYFMMWRLSSTHISQNMRAAGSLKKTILLMRRRTCVLAMNRWKLVISRDNKSGMLKQIACSQIQAILHRKQQNKKGLFFFVWRGTMLKSRMHDNNRSASVKVLTLTVVSALKRAMQGILRRYFARLKRAGLNKFHDQTSKTIAGRQMSRVYSAVFKKQYSRAFMMWRVSALLKKNAVSERERLVTIMVKSIDAILKQALRSSMKKWVEAVSSQKSAVSRKGSGSRLLRRIVCHWAFFCVARAFRTWTKHCLLRQIAAMTALMNNPGQLVHENKNKQAMAKKREAMIHIFRFVSGFKSRQVLTMRMKAWLRWGLFVVAKRTGADNKHRAMISMERTLDKLANKRLAAAFLSWTSDLRKTSERSERFSTGANALGRTVRRIMNRVLGKAMNKWILAVRMIIKKTIAMRRIVSRMQMQGISLGLSTWKRYHEMTVQNAKLKDLILRFQQVLMKNILLSMMEKGMHHGLMKWKLLVESEKLTETKEARLADRKKTGGKRLYDVIEAALAAKLRGGFNSWATAVESDRIEGGRKEDEQRAYLERKEREGRAASSLLVSFLNRMTQRKQNLAFRTWSRQIWDYNALLFKRRSSLAVTEKIVKKLLKSKLNFAFVAWTRAVWDYNERMSIRKDAVRSMGRVIHTILSGYLRAAFNDWSGKVYDAASLAIRRREALVRMGRALSVMFRTRVHAAFFTWSRKLWDGRSLLEKRANAINNMGSLVNIMLARQVHAAWRAWRGKSLSSRVRKMAIGMLKRAVKKIVFKRLAMAFDKWIGLVRVEKFAALRNAHVGSKLMIVFASFELRNLRRAWTGLVFSVTKARGSMLIGKYWRRILKGRCAEALDRWRELLLFDDDARKKKVAAALSLRAVVGRIQSRAMWLGFKKWLSFVASKKASVLREEIRDLSRRDGGYRILVIVRGCFLLAYGKAWRTWLASCSLARQRTSACNGAVRRLVRRLAASYVAGAFGLWRTAAKQRTALLMVLAEGGEDASAAAANEGAKWKLCLGLTLVDNFVKKKLERMKADAFGRLLVLVSDWNGRRKVVELGAKTMWAALIALTRRDVVRCFRKWTTFIVQMEKAELKRQTKLAVLKVVLAKAAKDGKGRGWNMLRLAWLEGKMERDVMDKRRVVMGKLIRGGTARSAKECFRRWERVAAIKRREAARKNCAAVVIGNLLAAMMFKQLSRAWRKLAYVRKVAAISGSGDVDESLRSELKGLKREIAVLTANTRRLACRSLSVVATMFRKKLFSTVFKIWSDHVSASQMDERINSEYSTLRDIMSSYGRLQAHVV